MANTKYVTKEVYEHRKIFVRDIAPTIVKKYQNELKKKYKLSYQSSPAKNGEFEDSSLFEYVNRTLRENIESDYLIQNDIQLLLDSQMKFSSPDAREEKRKKNPSHYHVDFPFYPTSIPLKVRELVNGNIEIYEAFYEQCIYSFLKKFYLRGSVSYEWMRIDQIYRNGFNKYINTYKSIYGNKTSKEIEESYSDLTKEVDHSFYVHTEHDIFAKYESLDKRIFDVRLIRFNFSELRYGETLSPNFLALGLNPNPIDYLPNNKYLEQYINEDYTPRNKVRELLGLPKIGEGWISETKLYYQIRERFPLEVVSQHYKPKWLGRQHFDIYFPLLNIAIEYQGKQHYEPVEFFGGQDAFKKNVKRDALKLKKSKNNNCTLIYVNPGYDLEEVVNEIKDSINKLANS